MHKNQRKIFIQKAFSNAGKCQQYFIMKHNVATMSHHVELYLNILFSCLAHKQGYALYALLFFLWIRSYHEYHKFLLAYRAAFRLLLKPFLSSKFNTVEMDVSSQLVSFLLNLKLLIVSIYSQKAIVLVYNYSDEYLNDKNVNTFFFPLRY